MVVVIASTFGCKLGYDKDQAMTDDHDVIRFPHCARRVDDLDAELAKLEAQLGASHMCFYKLDGHIPIRVETLKAWADEVARHDRITAETGIDPWRVDVTEIGDVVISTVFLALDYRRSRRGPPCSRPRCSAARSTTSRTAARRGTRPR